MDDNVTKKYKKCPFCAETILDEAVKCRYCGEFLNKNNLNDNDMLAVRPAPFNRRSQNNPEKSADEANTTLFEGRPSLFGLVGMAIKVVIMAALAVWLYHWPIEQKFVQAETDNAKAEVVYRIGDNGEEIQVNPESVPAEPKGFSQQQIDQVTKGRKVFAVGLIVLMILVFLIKAIQLKCIYYEVSADRVEFSRGILDRQIDNLDMFRVIDLGLRRTILDCIFGIGTVTLTTKDQSDPIFKFQKIRYSRQLYDVIKKASLAADRKNGVIHME